MEFLLLIYFDEKRMAGMDRGTWDKEMGQCLAFAKEHAAAIKGSNALQTTGTAATIRMRQEKQLVTDGPFAETKEQLGGYYLVEARDRDEALAIAAKNPVARYGSIEVRPIRKLS